nr:hypothetical protein [Tanacetum cinerariifolium]
MENTNLPPTNNLHVLPIELRARIFQELNKLKAILTYIDSRLENMYRFFNGFTQQPNEINVDDLVPDDELVDTPLVSPFLNSNDDPDDGEVLNELEEYGNAGQLCLQREINSFDRDDLAFQWKKLVAIVKDVYLFIGSFTYITDFVILEDVREFILRDIAEVVMGKLFRKVYDCAMGLMSFTRIFDNYTFQMPRIIPRFKN